MRPQSHTAHGRGIGRQTIFLSGIAMGCCFLFSTFPFLFSASRPLLSDFRLYTMPAYHESTLKAEETMVEKTEGLRKPNVYTGGLLRWMPFKYRAKGMLDRDKNTTVNCPDWSTHDKVALGVSSSGLSQHLEKLWESVDCHKDPIVPSIDTTASDAKGLPLVAIMAATTTRNVETGQLNHMALFRYLMPSIVNTAESGFRYLMVVGYDLGDPFYDSEDGQKQVHTWFEENVKAKLSLVGIEIELLPVPVDNTLRKPGPVFLEMARVAYKQGVEYFYRVNDDTELLNPWAVKFVSSLKEMGFPYGAVGPLCRQGNTQILTHDFTHRTHMEIFDGEYYPRELTDWWLDDWISRTYGSSRTKQSKTIEVYHHTTAHGTRYEVDFTRESLVNNLVYSGRDRIVAYMQDKGVDQNEVARFKEASFEWFPLEDIATVLPEKSGGLLSHVPQAPL